MGRRRKNEDSTLAAVLRWVEANFLTPDAAEIRRAEERADRLVQELHDNPDAWMFDVRSIQRHGSLARGTGLRGFKDLDRLVVLRSDSLLTRRGTERHATDTIVRMAGKIAKRRRGLISLGVMKVRPQNHSVGVIYEAGPTIDLVPAVQDAETFLIPERKTNRWIETDPDGPTKRLAAAGRRNPDTVVAIRLLKGWARARRHGAPLPSFAVESLMVDPQFAPKAPLCGLVGGFFEQIGTADKRRNLVLGLAEAAEGPVTVIDADSKNNLAEGLTGEQKKKLVSSCDAGLAGLERIWHLAEEGRVGPARTAARNLFVGPKWA